MQDFVVVGCGPAGSRFARQASEAGHDVLAFEQGQVGEPLACSGHVSTDLWAYTPDGTREALLQNEVYGARFHLDGPSGQDTGQPADTGGVGGGSDAGDVGGDSDAGDASNDADAETTEDDADADRDGYRFYKDEPVSNVIDRVGLDRTLAEAARDAGADVREGHTVLEVTEHDDRVSVEVRGPEGVETHEARMVAGCDGPTSRVRRDLDLPEPDELLHGVLGFETTPDHGDYVDVHLTVPKFFAWRIPRGDAGVEYGMGVPPGGDASERFEEFTADYGVTLDHRCSGLIPIGPPDRVTSERAFLIGDAAAQTKPFTGGGILYGMTAADCAVEAIDPDRPESLKEYESAWREELSREIRMGAWVRRAYSLPTPVKRAGMRAFEGEIGVHMDRPSTLFSKAQLKALFGLG